MYKKIFASFSKFDQRLEEKFGDFLLLGMGIREQDIFCTADRSALSTGVNFCDQIKNRMQECDIVVSLITEKYLESRFCMGEAGAACVLGKRYFPLLLVPYSALNDTLLLGKEMRMLDNRDDLCAVYDELCECGIARRIPSAQFNRRLNEFAAFAEQWRGKQGETRENLGK